MFDKARTSGHVDINMKRFDGRSKPDPRPSKVETKKTKGGKQKSDSVSHDPSEYLCLLRATLNKEKISTVVHAKDVNKFQLAYCALLKSHMDGLKRQKKQKAKKATAQ